MIGHLSKACSKREIAHGEIQKALLCSADRGVVATTVPLCVGFFFRLTSSSNDKLIGAKVGEVEESGRFLDENIHNSPLLVLFFEKYLVSYVKSRVY